jgi:membrane protease subunit HflK
MVDAGAYKACMPRPTFEFRKPPDWVKLRLLKWIVPVVLLVVVAFTAYYTVPAEAEGVVLRFGRFSSITPPGLHFKIPFGVDTVDIVPVRRLHKLEFGFGTPQASNPDQSSSPSEQDFERSMVTGDLNAVLVTWVVQYRIDDPRSYLFEVREPAATLRDLSEAVMREVIGDRTVDEVITIGRQDIEVTALQRLRKLSGDYQLGLKIEQLQLKDVDPPRQVQASFNEVNMAQQDRENMINVARGEYNKAVPRAQGEAEQKVSEAEGYKLKRVNEALGDAGAFSAVLAEYVKAPDVTRQRLYLEAMAEVLPGLANTWIVDDSVTQLLPVVQGAAARTGQ